MRILKKTRNFAAYLLLSEKMTDIAIYGAGGFGKEVACLIERLNARRSTWNFIGFFDDGKESRDFVYIDDAAIEGQYHFEITNMQGRSATVSYTTNKTK